jgi:hypothetical protein
MRIGNFKPAVNGYVTILYLQEMVHTIQLEVSQEHSWFCHYDHTPMNKPLSIHKFFTENKTQWLYPKAMISAAGFPAPNFES